MVKYEDSKALAEALQTYIENNEVSQLYSKALLLHIKAHFSESSAITAILNIYKGLSLFK